MARAWTHENFPSSQRTSHFPSKHQVSARSELRPLGGRRADWPDKPRVGGSGPGQGPREAASLTPPTPTSQPAALHTCSTPTRATLTWGKASSSLFAAETGSRMRTLTEGRGALPAHRRCGHPSGRRVLIGLPAAPTYASALDLQGCQPAGRACPHGEPAGAE